MVTFDPSTALVVVDVQNDFADPAGSLAVSGAEAIVPLIDGAVELARAGGAFVVYTQDWHPASTPHFAKDGGIWPVHCVKGTWGAQLHPALSVIGPVVRKGANGEDGYSGFSMRDPAGTETTSTELESVLREHGITRVIACGLATDYCVKATAIDAASRGFETSVLLGAIRAVELEPGDGERAIAAMREAGVDIIE